MLKNPYYKTYRVFPCY